MSSVVTIGIDNGQSGSIAILGPDGAMFEAIPTQDYLHYGKKGSIGKRLDRHELSMLISLRLAPHHSLEKRVFIERPFSGKFMNAVLPAHRFFEATIIVMEDLELGYEVIDSGTWQKPILGNVAGSAELKKASKLRGIQYYPALKAAITSQGDADGLLIAHYFHQRHGNSFQHSPTHTSQL